MNSAREEFQQKLPKLAANIALALAFGIMGMLSTALLDSITEGVGFYSWLVLTLVGGAFLIRALFDVLAIGDKTIESFLKRLGIKERRSKRRMAKDSMCMIATTLVAAAIFPLFETLGTAKSALQLAATAITIGIIFVFVYDIARTFYQILQEKAGAVTNRFSHEQTGGNEIDG